MSGNDGRFKSRHQIKSKNGLKELLAYNDIDEARSLEGGQLQENEIVKLGKKLKLYYWITKQFYWYISPKQRKISPGLPVPGNRFINIRVVVIWILKISRAK
ncbi:MAG: hypothetical protein PWR10_2093 [Halanaerobiales bacterium]|nr:hypothetical protein [Halanaerobiales bacterium]